MSEIENKNKQSTALERDTLECQAHTNSHIHGLTHTQTRNDYLDKTKQTVHQDHAFLAALWQAFESEGKPCDLP